jgi:glutamate synthase (NADPH/NADH) small chain
MPWPTYPSIYEKSSSHEEGCVQRWGVLTREFRGNAGRVVGLEAVEVDWSDPDESGRRRMTERGGTQFDMAVDLVILALGFTGPVKTALLSDLEVELDERGNVRTDGLHQTSTPRVFCAGDMEQGPSWVVRAIATAQEAAEGIHEMLTQG